MSDYAEKILIAMDTIATAKIEGLRYDITKICKIEDDTEKNNGKYIVSDGAITYDAYTTDTTLVKGNEVQVTIPNGDYDAQKTIIGRIATTSEKPFNYASPLDSMVIIVDNIYEQDNVISLLANGQLEPSTDAVVEGTEIGTLIGEIGDLSTQDLAGFTRLGISADFQCLLSNFDVASGRYGLRIKINADNDIQHVLDLTTDDMYGSLYNFKGYLTQEKVFDISIAGINKINSIKLYLFQNNDFKNRAGNHIDHGRQFDKGPWQPFQDNIFIKNVKLYFGYDISEYDKETLKLYTKDKLTFKYDEGLERTLSLRWIHQLEPENKDDVSKRFRILKEEEVYPFATNSSDEFTIAWYQYVEDSGQSDSYGGLNWKKIESYVPEGVEELSSADLECQVALDKNKQKEEFKAIGFWNKSKKADSTEKLHFVSSILTFTNEIEQVDQKTKSAISDFYINCEDGSEGNYFSYDQNGMILDVGEGQGKVRNFRLLYKGSSILDSFPSGIDSITWYVPKNNSMIALNNSAGIDSESNDKYYIIKRKYNGQDKFDYLEYCIKNNWDNSINNNTVKCEISINGVIHETLESLQFGQMGTNGSNFSFNLEFEEGFGNAIVIQDCSELLDNEIPQFTVEANLYDNKGQNIGFTASDKIVWSWWKKPDNDYLELIGANDNVANVKIRQKKEITPDNIPADNYYILQAEISLAIANTDKTQTLIAYLPIPMKAEGYAVLHGADRIIYDMNGKPSYNTGNYWVENVSEAEVLGCIFRLTNAEQINKANQEYYPTLKPVMGNQVALSASPFYVKDIENRICISAFLNNKVIWSQPIMVQQNQYGFTILNQWDGTLTIDEENGTILSTMMGAGRKNDDNTFSGVLMGDVQTGSGNTSVTKTGVYGFDKGVISFALKDDGTATIGATGHGQIQIDGTSGTIKSGSWLEESEKDSDGNEVIDPITNKPNILPTNRCKGMKIDLDDGVLEVRDSFIDNTNNYKSQRRIYLSPNGQNEDDSYFSVISSNNKELIHIANDEYYLQSDNYDDIGYGTKISLTQGTIISNGSPEGPFIKIDGSNPESLFEIKKDNINTSINIGVNKNFLQSGNYSGKKQKVITANGTDYLLYKKIGGSIYIGLSKKDRMSVYHFTKSGNTYKIDKQELFSEEKVVEDVFDSNGNKTGTKTRIITKEQKRNEFLSSYLPEAEDTGEAKGVQIDLNEGTITGYNLYLKGINSDDPQNKIFIIDSSSPTTPLQIGSKFNVQWDGTLTCHALNELKTPNTTKGGVININDNFVISAGGGASGSSFTGGYGGFGGLSLAGAKLSCTTQYFENITGLEKSTQYAYVVIDGKTIPVKHFGADFYPVIYGYQSDPINLKYVTWTT